MPHDHPEDDTVQAPGADEVAVLPWPMLLRERVSARVESSSRYPYLVLGTALFGLFSVGFTITILAVSIPTIAEDLGSSKSTLTWVITGPLLAFGIVGPTFGKLGDLYGQKLIYLIGIIGSAVFAIGIALSWSAASLIAFRVLGAAAGAACGPASMALIYSVFPREKRVQAMGLWSMVGAGGPVLGVVLGGPIVEALSWRLIFVIQAPLALFAALMASLILPETNPGRRTRLDVVGAVLLALGVTSVLLALNQGPVLGWSHPVVVGGFVAGPLLVFLFVWWERRVPAPLIKLQYLKRRNVAAPIATQAFTNFAYMGGFIITPLFLSEVFGYTPSHIGNLSIARPLAFAIAAPLGGLVAVRVGERRAGVAGAIAVVLSMFMLARLGGSASDALVMGSLALSGVGLGVSSPSMAATIANAVDEGDLGVAGAAQQLLTQVGVVSGIQLMQTVQVSAQDTLGLVGSYHRAYLLGAGVASIGVVTALFVRSSRQRDEGAPQRTLDDELPERALATR